MMSLSAEPSELSCRIPLHKAVFENDLKLVAKILRTGDAEAIGEKDMHGNTPLHLALMLGHKECATLLLAHNAPVKTKNLQGWSPLAEAISYGDRALIAAVLRKTKSQGAESIRERKPHLISVLKGLGDFYLELRWDFHSWIPFVSSMLPSDICKIYKKDGSIRLDTTLVDFNENTWERGDISFIFNAEAPTGESLVILDNKAKIFQKVRTEECENDVEQEVDIIMSSDIVNAQVSTKPISFHRAQTGWLFKQDRSEQIGEYQADVYAIDGLYLESKKRREHLSSEDLKKNKAVFENLRMGAMSNEEDWRKLPAVPHRKSLPPPTKMEIMWEEYVNAPCPGPCLGRPMIVKTSKKLFKAHVAMSEEFPLSIEALLDVLEIVAPFKHLNKLRMFCKLKLPTGFPVKIEIPLLPTVSANVTFQKLEFRTDIPDTYFRIPKNYCEEVGHFPDL